MLITQHYNNNIYYCIPLPEISNDFVIHNNIMIELVNFKIRFEAELRWCTT